MTTIDLFDVVEISRVYQKTRWKVKLRNELIRTNDVIYIVRKKSGCELSFTRANVLAIDSHSICDKNITFPVV